MLTLLRSNSFQASWIKKNSVMVASLKKVSHFNEGPTRMYKKTERKKRNKGLSYIDEGELPEFVKKEIWNNYVFIFLLFNSSI